MMKQFLFFAIIITAWTASAQNIQLHYDFGNTQNDGERNFFISTVEMFRPDTLGSTFFFIDFEYNSPHKPKGISTGYWEIAREFYIPGLRNTKGLSELALHIEYNDGVLTFPINDSTTLGDNINSSWLFGLSYPIHIGGFRLNTMAMYKMIRGSQSPDFQFTAAWFHMLWKGRITLSGFADVWSQDDFIGNPDEKVWILYSEPQIWYNINRHFSIGSEVKISNNFYPGSSRVEAWPTLGLKYDF